MVVIKLSKHMSNINCRFILAFFLLLTCFMGFSQKESKIDSLKILLKNHKSDTTKVNIYLKLHDLLRLSDFTQATHVAKESFELSEKLKWEKGIALTGRNYGIALSLTSKFDSANLILNRVIEVSRRIGDEKNIGYCQMTLGNIQYDQSNYDQALIYYFKSLHTYEKLDEYAGMSSALIWIGIIYQYSQEDYDAAIESYNSALKYANLGNATLNSSYIFSNLATIYYETNRYDSAIFYNKKSINVKLSYDDVRGLANARNNLANCFFDLEQYDSAEYYYSISLNARKQLNDKSGIGTSLMNLGRLYTKTNKITSAQIHLEEGVSIFEEIGFKEGLLRGYLYLTELNEAKGKYSLALQYHKKHKAAADSIFRSDRDETIEELQTKYETEKKEQQLVIQNLELADQKVTIQRDSFLMVGLALLVIFILVVGMLLRSRMRKKQELTLRQKELNYRELQLNAVIDSQEKERKRFATDLHDGFGQLISVLKMNVAAINKEDETPEKKKELFEKSTEILNGMYDELRGICFNLMPHTLIQEGLVMALKEFAGKVSLSGKVTVEVLAFDFEERLDDLKEISVYRIVQEWINNTLKYGDASNITIQLTKDDQEITLTVEDNGQGFDKDLLLNSIGNGWKNINSRTNLIKGILDIDTDPKIAGSMLILNIPHRVKVSEQAVTA